LRLEADIQTPNILFGECPEMAGSRRSVDEIHPWLPNGDLRPKGDIRGRWREVSQLC